MTIKLSDATKRVVRETTAPFEHEKDGELVVSDIRVRYYAETVSEAKANYEAYRRWTQEQDAPIFDDAVLSKRLESLPDIVGDDGKPIEITQELISSFSTKNTNAMASAIREDESPKSVPAKSD